MTFDEVNMYSGLAALHWSAYAEPTWDHDFYQRIVNKRVAWLSMWPAAQAGCCADT